jgi:hypothetical protein
MSEYRRGVHDGFTLGLREGRIKAEDEMREQPEQEPVAYTGDVARRMREAGMTFHLGMPHAAVMEQMTRFHDLVCAEASLRAAAAFAIPPRREWRGLSEEEIRRMGIETPGQQGGWNLAFARAIEQTCKEKNHG